jgi:hypothetical protein
MNALNKNTVIGICAAGVILIAIIAYFYTSQPTTVGSAPTPATTGQTK